MTADIGLDASTSALSLDDAPDGEPSAQSAFGRPARGIGRPPRGANNREAYLQRLANDPKFTPRVGGFWTHDQRLYEGGSVGEGYTGLRGMSEFWRGRGDFRGGMRGGHGPAGRGDFRGGMRGGGRGGRGGAFGPLGPGPGFHSRVNREGQREELASEVDARPAKGERRLEMDKLEAELEAQKARAALQRRQEEDEREEQPAPVEAEPISEPASSAQIETSVPTDDPTPAPAEVEQQAAPAVPPKKPVANGGGGKWGHEGYEAVQAAEEQRQQRLLAFQQQQVARGGFRGRVRGRGRGAFAGLSNVHKLVAIC